MAQLVSAELAAAQLAHGEVDGCRNKHAKDQTDHHLTDQPRGDASELVLQITYRIDPDAVTLIIRDQGPGFNPTQIPHAASDEDPIGHLDVRNEARVNQALAELNLTRIMVAHRPETINAAERVIGIQNGKALEVRNGRAAA